MLLHLDDIRICVKDRLAEKVTDTQGQHVKTIKKMFLTKTKVLGSVHLIIFFSKPHSHMLCIFFSKLLYYVIQIKFKT